MSEDAKLTAVADDFAASARRLLLSRNSDGSKRLALLARLTRGELHKLIGLVRDLDTTNRREDTRG